MKYKELYDYGVCGLRNAGIEECALDARLLLEHICHTNRNDLLVHGERDVAEADRDIYLEYIEKRKAIRNLIIIKNKKGPVVDKAMKF